MSDAVEQQVLRILKEVLIANNGSRGNGERARWLSPRTPENPDLRECQDCKAVKPLSEFDLSGRYHRIFCKSCRNKRSKTYRDQMSADQRGRFLDGMAAFPFVFKDGGRLKGAEVKAQRERQGGLCRICLEPLGRGKGSSGQQVEHDHKTMQPRGLTCRACNHNIGSFEEVLAMSPDYLKRLREYLAKPLWDLPAVDVEGVRRRMRHRGRRGRAAAT